MRVPEPAAGIIPPIVGHLVIQLRLFQPRVIRTAMSLHIGAPLQVRTLGGSPYVLLKPAPLLGYPWIAVPRPTAVALRTCHCCFARSGSPRLVRKTRQVPP